MTIKDQLESNINLWEGYYKINNMEAVVEDIAIEFAEWLILNHTESSFEGTPRIDDDTKILFNLFKREKEL
jgi:hypothetical protein